MSEVEEVAGRDGTGKDSVNWCIIHNAIVFVMNILEKIT
jgi:hypothetical protein